jgi:hypothetical protein
LSKHRGGGGASNPSSAVSRKYHHDEVKYVSSSLCGTFNNHEHNVVLPIDKLRSLLIKIATVKNDRNNYVKYYQKNQHIVSL